MSTQTIERPADSIPVTAAGRRRARRGSKTGISMLAQGEPMIWLTGGALAVALIMILGLIGTVIWLGMGTFAPQPVVQLQHKDGYRILGEISRQEEYRATAELILGQSETIIAQYTRSLVDDLGGDEVLAQLPALIGDHQATMKVQIADIDSKVERLMRMIRRGEQEVQTRIAAVQKGEGRVADRLAIIRASADGPRLMDYRNDLQTLQGKLTSLNTQIQAGDVARKYLQQALAGEAGRPPALEDVKQLLDAPRDVKLVALNALLARRAAQLGRRHVPGTRWLVRVGNKDLTGVTFRWVMDLEVEPDETSRPAWSIVVERDKWGRFYGQPQQFFLHHPRTVPADEERLAAIVQLFEQNLSRLDEAQQAEVVPRLESLREELAALRKQHVGDFLARFPADSRRAIRALVDGGAAVSPAELPDDANVSEVVEVWSGPDESWARLRQFHDDVLQRSRQRYDLKKHELGRVSRSRQLARQALRELELEVERELRPIYREKKTLDAELLRLTESQRNTSAPLNNEIKQRLEALAASAHAIELKLVNLVAVCNQVRQYEAQRQAIAHQIDQNQTLLTQIEKHAGQDSSLAVAARTIIAGLNEGLQAEMNAPSAKLTELRAQLARAPDTAQATIEQYFAIQKTADNENAVIQGEIDAITARNQRYVLQMVTADEREKPLALDSIVRAYPANQLSGLQKAGVYLSRWWEFLAADPREANSEGGVFPAIWGTVIMTLIMSVAVAPFGVLAAMYLREYAKAGPVVSAVRISINNLAGVPSIVFGVFGLGFFCYIVGAYIDGGPENAAFTPWSAGQWYLGLAGLAALCATAFACGLGGVAKPGAEVTAMKKLLALGSALFWVVAIALLALLIVKTPLFSGLYEVELPNPTFGKGGVLWASLTLALLTLPVVIVATEEALAAVPNSMREGSYGCGASKWQTIRRIVLPHAMPGIMTGMILAMARGAGEVAPLMLVGAVKLAPELPLDGIFPFVHADRSFMHLGFHIFDLGFQSQDSEAAKPMVFTTTLLLIVIIAVLNLGAVWLRARLRRRFKGGEF